MNDVASCAFLPTGAYFDVQAARLPTAKAMFLPTSWLDSWRLAQNISWKRLFRGSAILLFISLLTGCWISADLPPYAATFNIEWDEEVQINDRETIWVHRTEVYKRNSASQRWDARKVAEEISFPLNSTHQFRQRFDLGVIHGIEKSGEDWVVAYGGSNTNYLHVGSCNPIGLQCFIVVKPDGRIYKPANQNEIIDNFEPLAYCRTGVEDCFRLFNSHKISIAEKRAYAAANPRFNDSVHPSPTHRPLNDQKLTP